MQIDLNAQQQQPQDNEREPTQHRLRVPFIQTTTGLGDVIARATQALGIKKCGGCQKRQDALNHVQISPWET